MPVAGARSQRKRPSVPRSPRPRDRVIAGARKHFLAHGFHRVTMDELAAELGMSKKTLYALFPSKDALLEAVLEQKFTSVDAALRASESAHSRDFPAALRAMLASMQRELDELQPPFVHDMRRKAPHIFKRVEERRTKLLHAHFGKLLRSGQRAGDVRADVPVALIIETLVAAIQGVMNPQKVEELKTSPREVFTGVVELLLRGALKRKGKAS